MKFKVRNLEYRTNSAQVIVISYIRKITFEIGLHSFLTYIQLNISSSLCTRKECHNNVRIIKQLLTETTFFNVFPIDPNFDYKNKTIFAKIASVDLGLICVEAF